MEDNWLHARQAEEKRAGIATVNLLIASAMQGVFVVTGWHRQELPLSLWLILIGGYGIVTSLKLYERSQFHLLRARKIRAHLECMYPDAQVEPIYQKAEEDHKTHYAQMMNLRLNSIWVGLHTLILVLGILYSLLCLGT